MLRPNEWTVGMAVLMCACTAVPAVAGSSPNFVFILSDDQSWCGMSVQADPAEARSSSDYYWTPNLERLAEMGMRFSNGYSPAPFCCPTRRSLQIGQFPARHFFKADQREVTPYYQQQPTIPKVLKQIDTDYRTAHFGKWDFRTVALTPDTIGYDESDGPTNNSQGGSRGTGGPAARDDPKLIDDITDKACRFIEKCVAAEKPFYVQVSHWAVHLDVFYKKETYDRVRQRPKGERHSMTGFAAMTEDMDAGIGRILDTIEAADLVANTYIIFMSDNGGRADFPGREGEGVPNPNLPLRAGKGTMYEGGVRVPFIIAGPGIEEGAVCNVPVNGVDLLPTLADLAGQALQHKNLDGGSLRGVLTGNSRVVERNQDYLVFHHAIARRPQSAIRVGEFKLVKTYEENMLELFDLSKDLEEKCNLVQKMPDKAMELDAKLVAYIEEVGATCEREEVKPQRRKPKKSDE